MANRKPLLNEKADMMHLTVFTITYATLIPYVANRFRQAFIINHLHLPIVPVWRIIRRAVTLSVRFAKPAVETAGRKGFREKSRDRLADQGC